MIDEERLESTYCLKYKVNRDKGIRYGGVVSDAVTTPMEDIALTACGLRCPQSRITPYQEVLGCLCPFTKGLRYFVVLRFFQLALQYK